MPGVIGTLQALEAIKIAVGIKRILVVYIYNIIHLMSDPEGNS